jgi:hypothetical protein
MHMPEPTKPQRKERGEMRRAPRPSKESPKESRRDLNNPQGVPPMHTRKQPDKDAKRRSDYDEPIEIDAPMRREERKNSGAAADQSG